MSLYPNPFESRASEHQRGVHQFVSTFGAGAIDLLPPAVWDRLVVLRSSPGAGKTSLMRLFATDTLMWIRDRYDNSEPVCRLLTEREVIGGGRHPRESWVFFYRSTGTISRWWIFPSARRRLTGYSYGCSTAGS